MAFLVDRVKEVRCKPCGQRNDTSKAKPMSTIRCRGCGKKLEVPARLGQSILIFKPLGRGTGSIVYEGFDETMRRSVAVKVIQPAGASRGQDGIAEARALARLNHPNVVQVFDIDTEHGQPCIIMERLEGGSLDTMLKRNGRVNEALALSMTGRIASALRAAQDYDLLHLDVKPANIMFDLRGTPKLLDFGYAAIDFGADSTEIPGTPYYVSPELLQKAKPDLRCDIYSLGATLYHILTGHAPFEGQNIAQLLKARLNAEPIDPREIMPGLSVVTGEVVRRMMHPAPQSRYQDYDTLLADLGRAAA